MQAQQANANGNRYKWLKLIAYKGGHRYFRNLVNDHVSVCDDSGETPHLTDDGVLYIDISRSIVIDDNSAVVPVVRADGLPASCCESALNALSVAAEFGFDVEITGDRAAFVRRLFDVMSSGTRVKVSP